MSLIVHTIPAFTDNYIWLFHQPGNNSAYVVDPGDANPVIEALNKLELSLAGIIVTHHHPDHVGGIYPLLDKYQVPVYGPEGIPQVSKLMKDGDALHLAETKFQVLAVPGHTLDHLAYFAASEPLVFCGDTLFAGGCGRLFEGTPEQMWLSLSHLARLPTDTLIYCTHEYTQANLEFALTVEPENKVLQQRVLQVRQQRQQNQSTIPSTLAEELSSNPFLRAGQPSIRKAAEEHEGRPTSSDEDTFTIIRRWKDHF
ncbi:MAG: hydroxyacylglutathione hydrolase [Porticoccus sp.]